MTISHTRKIPLHLLTSQQKANMFYCRPICYMNNICDEDTCRAFQKENKGSEYICYLDKIVNER